MTRSKKKRRSAKQRTGKSRTAKREKCSARDHRSSIATGDRHSVEPVTEFVATNDDEKVIANVVTELEANIELLAARRRELPAGGFDPELASATAAIAKAALTAAGERRQRAKGRKRELELFTDDELAERLRALPERRRDAIIIAAQGEDLSGKPLYP